MSYEYSKKSGSMLNQVKAGKRLIYAIDNFQNKNKIEEVATDYQEQNNKENDLNIKAKLEQIPQDLQKYFTRSGFSKDLEQEKYKDLFRIFKVVKSIFMNVKKEKYNVISHFVGDKELNKYMEKQPINNNKIDEDQSNEMYEQTNQDELEDIELLKLLNRDQGPPTLKKKILEINNAIKEQLAVQFHQQKLNDLENLKTRQHRQLFKQMELLPDKLPKQQNFFLYRQQSAERMYNPTTTTQCKNENEGELAWKKVQPRQIHTSQCRQQTRQRLPNSEEPLNEYEINLQNLYEAQFGNPSFKGQLKYLPIKQKQQQFCLLANSSEELQQQFQQAMKTQQNFYNQVNTTKLKKELQTSKNITMQQLIQRKKKQRALKLQQELKEKRQNEEQKDWERPKYLTKNNATRYFLKSASVQKFDSKLAPIKKQKQIHEKPELNIEKKQFMLTANDQNNQFLQQQIINQNNERKKRQSGDDFSPKKSYKRQISSNVLSYLDTKIWTNIKQ